MCKRRLKGYRKDPGLMEDYKVTERILRFDVRLQGYREDPKV